MKNIVITIEDGTKVIQRVDNAMAAVLIEAGRARPTSKSRMKRAIKDNRPRYSPHPTFANRSLERQLHKEGKKTGLNGKVTKNYKKQKFQYILNAKGEVIKTIKHLSR